MSNKEEKSKKNLVSEFRGIYALNGIKGENTVKIKHIETIKLEKGKNISDTFLDRFNIGKKINAEIYACNIIDAYLLSSKKQPILHVCVWWEPPLRRVLLYRLCLFFTVESDVETAKEFLSKKLEGKFSTEVIIEGKNRPLGDIEKYPGNKKIIEMLKSFTKMDSMIELTNSLIKIEQKKIHEKYGNDFEDMKPPKKTINLMDIDLEDY